MRASRQIINMLIAGGMDDLDAMALVAQSAVEMADKRSPGAKRTAGWRDRKDEKERLEASQNVTKRHTDVAPQNVSERHKTSQCDDVQNPPISTSKISKESKRQNRGTRIATDWAPTDAERAFAKQEGFSDWEIQREAQKFRDYWTACAGSKGVKLDWSATWRQWIRRGADRAGKTPSPNNPGAAGSGYYATPDSDQLAAWDVYNLNTTGKRLPRDKNQGWRVKAEWPPGYVAPLDRPAYQEAGE